MARWTAWGLTGSWPVRRRLEGSWCHGPECRGVRPRLQLDDPPGQRLAQRLGSSPRPGWSARTKHAINGVERKRARDGRRSSLERHRCTNQGVRHTRRPRRRTNLDDSTGGTDRVVRTRAGAWAPGSSSAPGNSTATTRRPLVAALVDGRVRRSRRTSAADDDPASTEPLTDPAAASVFSSPRTTRRRRSPSRAPPAPRRFTSAHALVRDRRRGS
jgi:hypothetical protein